MKNREQVMPSDEETRQREFINLMMRFRLDVTLATNSLIYTLYGINLVHRKAEWLPVNAFPVPAYPPLKVFPQVAMNSPFSERTAPNGPIEQLAFKSWVTDVYDSIWEGTYRNKLRKAFRNTTSRKVPMETDPLGDLRLIRNDLIHNKSIGNECAKCKILKWFGREEQMQLRVGHVLDFLNQMGWIGSNRPIATGNRVIMWSPPPEEVTPSEQAPSIVSVRPLIYEPEQFQYRYCASVVFGDGFFVKVPFELHDGTEMTDKRWRSMRTDSNGDLSVPPEVIVSARQLYTRSFESIMEGPGTYSPAFRIG